MKKIAITGGIAEGKSTVAGYLRSAGYMTISADEIASEVFRSPEVQSQLAGALGRAGPVSAEELRLAIASDVELRRRTNAIMHPQILEKLTESSAPFAEVPLLIETCLQGHFDRVWVVTCGIDEQLRRLTARLGDIELAHALLATQLPTAAKTPFADLIVRTNHAETDVMRYVLSQAERELENEF